MNEVYRTESFNQTQDLGKLFSSKLKKGDIVALRGNLGSGKTTFVQGLANGLGIMKRINSPTFVIIRSYNTPQAMFYHVDLYRLANENSLEGIGLLEILEEQSSILAIEWPEKMGHYLPKRRWDISFTDVGENIREIRIKNYE